jgi:predicted ATP-binding protein involved in virulence
MGENGVGKTITLKMIEAIFSQRLEYLMDKDFSDIIITFHKETWYITKRVDYNQKYPETLIKIKTTRKGIEPMEVALDLLQPRVPPIYVRENQDAWRHRRTDIIVSREEIMERFGADALGIEYPEWYQHQCSQNRVRLIKTQRLYQETNHNERQILSVRKYSVELSSLMQEEIAKAAKNTGDLDRTFPKRLLRQMRSNHKYLSSEILSELHRLERHRLELSDLGLLTETETSDAIINELNENDSTMLSVLHLYVKDSWEKLRCYDNLYEKLSLLKEIINSRYNHKTFTVDSTKGFVIYPTDKRTDKVIPVEMLSSGEQNELVLFYEMLFKCDSKDLILIDEPEISLHLEWLQTMISDLIKVSEKNKVSLLIATHSPDFVGENYDLVQHLN